MKPSVSEQVRPILSAYQPASRQKTADELRALWLQFEPLSIAGIKAELREQQETVGTPVAVLRAIGDEIANVARKRVEEFIPLAQLLWDDYGREGRVVALIVWGALELAASARVFPLLIGLCRACVTWEDADRLAMDALEPVVRQQPDQWLSALSPWLTDENKWVRRAGATVIGRLPMKHPAFTARCLELLAPLLGDAEVDVKKAVSFGIRLAARGDASAVRDFLAHHVPPADPAAAWVLCDAIRSMTKQMLPEFAALLPRYATWAAAPALSASDRRSVESALKVLHSA